MPAEFIGTVVHHDGYQGHTATAQICRENDLLLVVHPAGHYSIHPSRLADLPIIWQSESLDSVRPHLEA